MKSRYLCLAAAAVSLTSSAAPSIAADRQKPEVGMTLASLTAMDLYDDTIVAVAVPGNSFLGVTEPGLHAAIPAGDKLCIEPQAGLIFMSGDGDSNLLLTAALQVNVALAPWQSKTPYFFGRGGAMIATGDGSNVEPIIGGGVGYRVPVRDFAVIRWEAYYNRYLDSEVSQFGARVKLGIVF